MSNNNDDIFAAGHTLGGVHPDDCYQGPPEDTWLLDEDEGTCPYTVVVREVHSHTCEVWAINEAAARAVAMQEVEQACFTENGDTVDVGTLDVAEDGVSEGHEDE